LPTRRNFHETQKFDCHRTDAGNWIAYAAAAAGPVRKVPQMTRVYEVPRVEPIARVQPVTWVQRLNRMRPLTWVNPPAKPKKAAPGWSRP